MVTKVQKNIVLFALFIVPLLFYIFLQLSTHNFAKLPVVTTGLKDIPSKDISFSNKVTVVTFLGNDFKKLRGESFNLNEKIYKKFYDYKDFQFVSFFPKNSNFTLKDLKEKIAPFSTINKWYFVPLDSLQIQSIYTSFKSNKGLDTNFHSSEAFIIDKDLNLRRGKTSDKQDSNKLGYNMKSVSELKKEMHDDVKILLAEYRFALKKNNKRKI